MNKKPYVFPIILLILSLFSISNNVPLSMNKENKQELIQYNGNDLVFNSLTVTYDGKTHSIIASCPIEWSVSYNKENTYKDVGIYEIEATFKDETFTYEDVKKVATLTILEKERPNYIPIILCSTLIPIGCIGIRIGTYFLVNYYKKKKYTKPL